MKPETGKTGLRLAFSGYFSNIRFYGFKNVLNAFIVNFNIPKNVYSKTSL